LLIIDNCDMALKEGQRKSIEHIRPNARIFNDEERDLVCDGILSAMEDDGLSLTKACAKFEVPRSTFSSWMCHDKKLVDRYMRSRELLANHYFDQIIDIADAAPPLTDRGCVDHGAVADKKVRMWAREFVCGRLSQKLYGTQRVEVENKSDAMNAMADSLKVMADKLPL
jgi:hypothetical protein